jgi:hypothetical protein
MRSFMLANQQNNKATNHTLTMTCQGPPKLHWALHQAKPHTVVDRLPLMPQMHKQHPTAYTSAWLLRKTACRIVPDTHLMDEVNVALPLHLLDCLTLQLQSMYPPPAASTRAPPPPTHTHTPGNPTHLIEEVDVALPLHLLDRCVLLQWSTAQLLVGCDDVDALLHPLKVVAGGDITAEGREQHKGETILAMH